MNGYPPHRRLRKRREFLLCQQEGKPGRGKLATIIVREFEGETRLGVVASRRVGNAVVRNRLKRRTREWFRLHRDLPARLDIVVILKPQAATASQAPLVAELNRVLKRACDAYERARNQRTVQPSHSTKERPS